MIEGGTKILLEKFAKGEIAGAIGIGGANGTNLVCSILRALPYLVPKVMISTVAGTAAVQWYVAESDIAMYPSIGDVSINRITKRSWRMLRYAVAMAANNWAAKRQEDNSSRPLIAVSSFGGTAACVERVSDGWKPWATRSSCFTPQASAASRSNGLRPLASFRRRRCDNARTRGSGRRRRLFRGNGD